MITLRCPNCRERVDAPTLTCPNGHAFEQNDGVLKLLTPEFGAQLETIERSLSSYRETNHKRITDPAIYDGLPFNKAADDQEWALRAKDARTVGRLARQDKRLRVLDIGAWNGWLCNSLAARGHTVVGIDYFADEFDGLGAQRHYSSDYDTIQMDLCDLSVIDDVFDLVIVNHGLAFFSNPLVHLRNSLGRVRAGGILIVLGLQFFRDPTARKQQVREMERRYREHCGVDLFFRPTRAYLDWNDKVDLERLGLTIHSCRLLWKQNLLSRFQRQRPYTCHATMTQSA